MMFGKKLEGLLPKPLPFLDLFSGGYVGYQGHTSANRSGRFTIYLKKDKDTTIYQVHNVPEKALQHILNPGNTHSPSEGVYVLLGGEEGIPTILDQIGTIKSEMMQQLAEEKRSKEQEIAARKMTEKALEKSMDEKVTEITKQHKKLNEATSSGSGLPPMPNRNL